MNKSMNVIAALLVLLCLMGMAAYSRKAQAQAPSQYPILDMVADKVIQKYQQSTCEDLWKKQAKKAPPTAAEQQVLMFLRNDPQMRAVFINKVAPPIANKMFECGMIP